MRIIAGTLKNKEIAAPKGDVTRPTSALLRAALFNICQQDIDQSNFLDLFAGSGVMGIEAISRGAKFATFVDIDRESVRSIKKNIDNAALQDNTLVIQGDVLQVLDRLIRQECRYDIIYADPPYEDQYSNLVLKKIDQSSLIKSGGILFFEESKRAKLDFNSLTSLKLISQRAYGRSALFELQKV